MRWLVLTFAVVALCLEAVHAQTKQLKEIHIVDANDSSKGIIAKLTLIDDEHRTSLQSSDNKGIRVLEQAVPCTPGLELEVVPGSIWYARITKSIDCAQPEMVLLQQRKFTWGHESPDLENLTAHLGDSKTSGALAALLYSEVAAESATRHPEFAAESRQRAIVWFAESSGYRADPFAPNGVRLSEDFIAWLKRYQEQAAVPQTGLLDYPTLSALANTPIYPYKYLNNVPPHLAPGTSRLTTCLTSTAPAKPPTSAVPESRGLLARAVQEEAQQRHSVAAMLFNEVATRSSGDPAVAQYAEFSAYDAVGKTLGVDQPVSCDPLQGKFVMSPSLRRVLLIYQAEHQLSPTGQLDYQTMRKLSGSDIGPYLGNTIKSPGQ